MAAGAKVSVGCKLPNGLQITLEKLTESINADGHTVKRYVPIGAKVLLKGTNTSVIFGGYGITEDIDADWFTQWLKDNADYEPVRLGLIFMQSTPAKAADAAKERVDVLSGFEPMNPDKPGDKLEPVPA